MIQQGYFMKIIRVCGISIWESLNLTCFQMLNSVQNFKAWSRKTKKKIKFV